MSDLTETSPAPSRRFVVPIHWGRAVGAGVAATIIMTIVGIPLKMNFMKMLGTMVMPGGSPAAQYAVGGAMHFMIGIIYGIIYVALVARLLEWNRFIKGAVYGLTIAAIAFAAMPVMSSMMGGGRGAGNPCGGGKSASYGKTMNPCYSQGAKQGGESGPMNPCHGTSAAESPQAQAMKGAMASSSSSAQSTQSMNPCHGKIAMPINPCHGKSSAMPMNPCHTQNSQASAGNPCHSSGGAMNACHGGGAGNPCGGSSGGPWSGVMSVLNHLVYAFSLALVYGKAVR